MSVRARGAAGAALLLAALLCHTAASASPVDVAEPASTPSPPPKLPRLWDSETTGITASVLVGLPVLGYFTWWRVDSRSTFGFANERWFQGDTYAGGADKASHIFFGYFGTQMLQAAYSSVGKTPTQARGLALGVATLAGAFVEVGDGYSKYGFAWEDIAANTIGSLVATGIDAWGLRDTVGLRFGYVKVLEVDACCRFGGYGDDYSKEIYSLDLKLAGILPRVGVKPGPGRFFLLSLTYGSKGYRYSAAPLRERNVGLELGLNLREILVAAGVSEKPLWGKVLLAIATYFRFPYTSFGWHYDLNHGTWSGPDTGDRFDPGSIIYD
ncbi:MAG: DUF2279 domain-containing protein [Acidobacteriota bacterium]